MLMQGLTTEQLKQKYQTPTQQGGGVQGTQPTGLTTEQLKSKFLPKSVEVQKQERIAQGLPVSVREGRVEPTMAGNIVREIGMCLYFLCSSIYSSTEKSGSNIFL